MQQLNILVLSFVIVYSSSLWEQTKKTAAPDVTYCDKSETENASSIFSFDYI